MTDQERKSEPDTDTWRQSGVAAAEGGGGVPGATPRGSRSLSWPRGPPCFQPCPPQRSHTPAGPAAGHNPRPTGAGRGRPGHQAPTPVSGGFAISRSSPAAKPSQFHPPPAPTGRLPTRGGATPHGRGLGPIPDSAPGHRRERSLARMQASGQHEPEPAQRPRPQPRQARPLSAGSPAGKHRGKGRKMTGCQGGALKRARSSPAAPLSRAGRSAAQPPALPPHSGRADTFQDGLH